MRKFLDVNGLTYFFSKISDLLADKQDTLPQGNAQDVLTYNGSSWVAAAPTGGSGSGITLPTTAGDYILTIDSDSDYNWTAVSDGDEGAY